MGKERWKKEGGNKEFWEQRVAEDWELPVRKTGRSDVGNGRVSVTIFNIKKYDGILLNKFEKYVYFHRHYHYHHSTSLDPFHNYHQNQPIYNNSKLNYLKSECFNN
jgi:hypothetical protein